MSQVITPDETFFHSLRQLDLELFLAAKAKGCPHCGGPLDTANYPRKTRGMSASNELCFSLCCRRDGCRKRKKPRSVRFLGRRVYGAWVVILAVDFCRELGLEGQIARQTVARWRVFWRELLTEQHPFLRKLRGFLPPGAPITDRPASVLGHFGYPNDNSLIRVLNFCTESL